MALDLTLNGYLMWTLAQHVQDLEEAGTPRTEAMSQVAIAAGLDLTDVVWAFSFYPSRAMPDERIFPIPPEDLARIKTMEARLTAAVPSPQS